MLEKTIGGRFMRRLGMALGVLATIAIGMQGLTQDKATDCQAIADAFQQAQGDFQNTGNLSSSLGLTDRLVTAMKKLTLKDPTLKALQARYITYFTSSNNLLKEIEKKQGDETALRGMMAVIQKNSAEGSALGQELITYCIE